jgi:hypothetical protein
MITANSSDVSSTDRSLRASGSNIPRNGAMVRSTERYTQSAKVAEGLAPSNRNVKAAAKDQVHDQPGVHEPQQPLGQVGYRQPSRTLSPVRVHLIAVPSLPQH